MAGRGGLCIVISAINLYVGVSVGGCLFVSVHLYVCVRMMMSLPVSLSPPPSPLPRGACCGRLRDKCEALLLIPGLPQRRKVEELLWKKVFYDVIQKCRASRKVRTGMHTLCLRGGTYVCTSGPYSLQVVHCCAVLCCCGGSCVDGIV